MTDVHKTLIQVMRGKTNATEDEVKEFNFHYAYDLLNEIIADNRTCKHIVEAETFCLCK